MISLNPRALWCAGVLVSGLAACGEPTETFYDPDAFYQGATFIESVAVSCSADSDSWEVRVETAGWTAGGLMAWSPDGYYLEQHPLISQEADFYGEWDVLVAELSVSADPRYVSSGSSTALLCDPPTRESLRGWLAIYDPDSEAEVDCRVWGEVLDWGAAGYSDCGEVTEISLR